MWPVPAAARDGKGRRMSDASVVLFGLMADAAVKFAALVLVADLVTRGLTRASSAIAHRLWLVMLTVGALLPVLAWVTPATVLLAPSAVVVNRVPAAIRSSSASLLIGAVMFSGALLLLAASGDRHDRDSTTDCVELRGVTRGGQRAPPHVAHADRAGTPLPFLKQSGAIGARDRRPLASLGAAAVRLAFVASVTSGRGDGPRRCAYRSGRLRVGHCGHNGPSAVVVASGRLDLRVAAPSGRGDRV